MQTPKAHRIFSILMASLLLLSSTGFSVDLHFCKGQIKSFSLFGTAKSCHKTVASTCNAKQKSCHSSLKTQETSFKSGCEKTCCSNATFNLEPDKDFHKVQLSEASSFSVDFIAISPFTIKSRLQNLPNRIIPYLNYIPPLLKLDLLVWIQTFIL